MCCDCENKEGKCGCAVGKLGNKIGLFFVFLSVLCFVWYFIHPVEQELHLSMLRMSFFWFSGMNGLNMLLALVQMYIFGYVVAGLWFLAGCCGRCCGKCEIKKEERKPM